MNAHTSTHELEALDTCAFEGFADHGPSGKPFNGLHPRSRVFRDDSMSFSAWGKHYFLLALGAVLGVVLPGLCLLFATGVLPLKSTRPLPPGVITMAAPEVQA